MAIKRGDIYYVSVEKTQNWVQGGTRPAVIVSNDLGNHFSPVVEVVFLTTRAKKPLPTHCYVYAEKPSIAICEQVTSVAKTNLLKFVKSCSDLEMQNINNCLRISLGLEV